jgi:hypothetical protein
VVQVAGSGFFLDMGFKVYVLGQRAGRLGRVHGAWVVVLADGDATMKLRGGHRSRALSYSGPKLSIWKIHRPLSNGQGLRGRWQWVPFADLVCNSVSSLGIARTL